MIQIDKNVPVPKHNGKHSEYPFDSMEVGDSFSVAWILAASVRNCYSRYKPKKFSTRKMGDNIRVWRIE